MEQQKRIRLAQLTAAQYDAILNHCNSNIFVTDGQGMILYANDATERALNCDFAHLRQMDIYQLMERGYTSHSSSADAIRTRQKAFAVYTNNLGEEIATTSIPVMDDSGQIELVVTRSDEVGSILAQQKELDRYRSLYKEALARSDSPRETLVAEAPRMREILATLEKYAQSDAAILLTGESGTGKEVLANYIKRNSARHDDAFLSVNCAAIPNELIESELFGYERGAFPAPIGTASRVFSSWPMAGPSFWMRWENSPWSLSPNCCGYWKTVNSEGWAAARPIRQTCVSSQPLIVISKK